MTGRLLRLPPSDFIDVRGQLVHLRDVGRRDDPLPLPLPLLLLHGTGASLHTWGGWVAAATCAAPNSPCSRPSAMCRSKKTRPAPPLRWPISWRPRPHEQERPHLRRRSAVATRRA